MVRLQNLQSVFGRSELAQLYSTRLRGDIRSEVPAIRPTCPAHRTSGLESSTAPLTLLGTADEAACCGTEPLVMFVDTSVIAAGDMTPEGTKRSGPIILVLFWGDFQWRDMSLEIPPR